MPKSAMGLKRPLSEYTRIARGLGDANPRYKVIIIIIYIYIYTIYIYNIYI